MAWDKGPPCVQVPLEFHLQSGFISRVKQPKKSRLSTRQTCSPVCFWTYIIIPFDQLLSLLSSPQDSHYRIKTSCHMTAQECTKGSYIAPSRFSDVQVRFEEPRRLFSKGPFTAVIHAGPFVQIPLYKLRCSVNRQRTHRESLHAHNGAGHFKPMMHCFPGHETQQMTSLQLWKVLLWHRKGPNLKSFRHLHACEGAEDSAGPEDCFPAVGRGPLLSP